jgi:hypothetical protein
MKEVLPVVHLAAKLKKRQNSPVQLPTQMLADTHQTMWKPVAH